MSRNASPQITAVHIHFLAVNLCLQAVDETNIPANSHALGVSLTPAG